MKRADVCITGIGAATPLGHSYEVIADRLLNGMSGVRKVTAFPVTDHPSKIAAEVGPIPCPQTFAHDDYYRLRNTDQLMLWCAANALQKSGWWNQRANVRVGIILGTTVEWLAHWERDFLAGGEDVLKPQSTCESAVHRLRVLLGISGPAVSLSAACASANYALALARRWLELGWVDVCLSGGGDMGVTPTTLAGFANLRALSRRNDEPDKASRPFDTERDGFVLGEGAVLFLLEKEETAHARGAPIHARIAGFGASSDAFHMVIPNSDCRPAVSAMQRALADAAIDPRDVHYINAHATSTPVGDVAECRAMEAVFGSSLGQIPVSSTKSMTGHLLTGAAAFEALACIVALERGAIPPTINLQKPDPECRVLHVANQAEERRVKIAISNSFGFGGSNTCLVLRAA